MGTTIVVAMFYDNQTSIGHIGDSRANRLHDMELEQVTTNHCFVQEDIDKGLCAEEETRPIGFKSHTGNLEAIDEILVADMEMEYRFSTPI